MSVGEECDAGRSWDDAFGRTYHKGPSGSPEEVAEALTRALSPLTPQEVSAANAFRARVAGPAPETGFDAARWSLPGGPFPDGYVGLLAWANGGTFETGDREVGLFAVEDLREMQLGYELPEYMPDALAIGFDGGGAFYVLDLRQPPSEGEVPVFLSHAGNLAWADTRYLGACLRSALSSPGDPMNVVPGDFSRRTP